MTEPILINLAMVFNRPTGIANYALNVTRHLDSLNPILLTSSTVANTIDGLRCEPVPHNMTPAEGSRGHLRRLWWTQWQLPKLYQKFKASLIYSPIPEAPLYTGCPYVVMCHDLIPLRFPRWMSPLTNYFRLVVPQVLRQARHVICNSEATARDIRQFYGIPSNKISPILLAYDATHFYQRAKSKITNLDTTHPYFLYLGRHDPYKNLASLIAAFAQISSSVDCNLYLAGTRDSRFTPQLEQQVRELDLRDRIKFLDYVAYQNLPNLLSQAVALVFPTLWEGFGLPVLEAMACGTPVITSNLASLPEVTKKAAVLIDPYKITEIAKAMQAIALDTQMRSQLSQLGLERAKQFSWTKTAVQTQAILQQFS